MGYGAYFTVTNNRSRPVRLFVTNVQCMYDNGDQGSRLSLFNNAIVNASSSLPVARSQYIEVNATGSCFFLVSTFDIKVNDLENGATIGTASFKEGDFMWYLDSNSNEDLISVSITNGQQAQMSVTITEG